MRKRIDIGFEQLARFICQNRLKVLGATLLAVAALVSNLPKLEIDTSTEGFLHETDPALVTFNEFRAQYGRAEIAVVSVGPAEVFDLLFLERLRAFHDDLESSLPHLDEVNSLINARSTRGEADELIVEDLLEDPPTEADLPALRSLVLSNPLYRNLLISEDGRFTTVMIKTLAYSSGEATDLESDFDEEAVEEEDTSEAPFLSDEENSEMVRALHEAIARHARPDFPLQTAGMPVVSDEIKRSMLGDMRKFMLMALATIAIFLFITFRRISGVILPLLVVIVSLISTVSLMAACGVAIKIPTQILPSFLMAVGVGDAVHILAIFYMRLHKGDAKEEAIVYALRHAGLAITMTSLTTAAGLASFSTAEVAPIADLGIFASAGVMLALFYTILLLPALIALLPIPARTHASARSKGERLDRILIGFSRVSTQYPRRIVAVSVVLILGSLALATQIRFSHDPLAWLPESSPSRVATELIDRELRGSITLEVLLDSGVENGLYEPAFLKRIDETNRAAQAIEQDEIFVGKTIALTDVLKEIHQALNENQSTDRRIPDDRNLVAQELLLFENAGSDDLKDVVDSSFQTSRVTLKANWQDAVRYAAFSDTIEALYVEAFGDTAEIRLTGILPLLARTVTAAMHSALKSYLIAGVVITGMMMLLVGSARIGLISMIPNLLPIVLMLGIMGIFDMPMDMFTMLIGSIAIGLAVDDTVHFMQGFRRLYAETGDVYTSVRDTLLTTGRAMLATTVVLSIGFFIFMFASMSNLFNFGLLTGFAISTALLGDFLLAPALMTLAMGRRERKARAAEKT